MCAVELLVLHVAFNFHPRLKEKRDDQNDSDHKRGHHSLEGWPLGVDESPGDVVVQGFVCRAEPVPGQEDRQKCWRVQHQRRQRVEDVRVRHDEELPSDLPAQKHEERKTDVAGVDEQKTDEELVEDRRELVAAGAVDADGQNVSDDAQDTDEGLPDALYPEGRHSHHVFFTQGWVILNLMHCFYKY